MKKLAMLCGSAAALLLVSATTQSEAFARGEYGWSSDYVGNEWIGRNIRNNGGDEAGAPKSKRARSVKAQSNDDDTPAAKPNSKSRRRAASSESSSGGNSFQSGIASYYWQPQRVASGGWFNPNAMTAAHKSLPFGTKVRVTHRSTGRAVTVTINDRGPYIAGRVIDLSLAAAGALGIKGAGIAPVELAVLGR